jgi:hypothetical protein
MEEYANRRVFTGLNVRERPAGVAFRMMWHRDREFDLVVDTKRRTLTLPVVLPSVAESSLLFKELKGFLRAQIALDLPTHRRLDPKKVRLRASSPAGDVSFTMRVLDLDYEYALQRLLHVVHEMFVIFLAGGRFYEYKVEHLGADPDWG